jgi:hypothetical protein
MDLGPALSRRAAPKYARDSSRSVPSFSPIPYPGCTVLAKPYPLDLPGLAAARRSFSVLSDAFAAVPVETFHVTLADLVVGRSCEQLKNRECEEVVHQVRAIIALWHPPIPIRSKLIGLHAFPGALVGLVAFENKSHYEALVSLRRDIYTDQRLRALGVRWHFPLIAHVTIGYLEAAPSAEFIREVARKDPEVTEAFEIHGADVFTFPHMSCYEATHEPGHS